MRPLEAPQHRQEGPPEILTFSVTDRKRLQKAGGKKSRIGCKQCRLRRVKCDETKPECLKCIKTRRTCDFQEFSVIKTPKDASCSPTPKPENLPLAKSPEYFTKFTRDQGQWDMFSFYVSSSLAEGPLPAAQFFHIVPQLAVEHPGVMEVCCSIGALHRSIISAASSSADDYHLGMTRSLEHYGRALSIVRKAAQKCSDNLAVIIVSLLFFNFDLTLGDLDAAKNHLRHAFEMLDQRMQARSSRDGTYTRAPSISSAEVSVLSMLRRITTHPQLSRMEYLNSEVDNTRGVVSHCCRGRRDKWLVNEIPPTFDTLELASEWWDATQHFVIHETRGFQSLKADLPNTDRDYPTVFAALYRWHAAFQQLYQRAERGRAVTTVLYLEASVLQCVYLQILAALHALTRPASAVMPDLKQLHLNMITTIERLMQESPSPSSTESMLYNRWVRLLTFIVRQTLDQDVQEAARQALSAIEDGPAIIDSFRSRSPDDIGQADINPIYGRVADWHFMTIGCSIGLPAR